MESLDSSLFAMTCATVSPKNYSWLHIQRLRNVAILLHSSSRGCFLPSLIHNQKLQIRNSAQTFKLTILHMQGIIEPSSRLNLELFIFSFFYFFSLSFTPQILRCTYWPTSREESCSDFQD